VGNYRAYDEQGAPAKGKFALEFEEAYRELSAQERYRGLLSFPLDSLHNGYFAQDKKGILKDTGGNTQADDDVYNLIMKDKERLLSLDEPLRFIFSHSALREGWDNPNVFQICTLNESRSATRKRQEIGRGLRLPVNQNGERVFDENLNKLLVVANESYNDFARSLQTEYEEDCGVTFGKVPRLAFSKLVTFDGEKEVPVGHANSEKIWTRLVEQGLITPEGKILPKFDPKAPGFDIGLAAEHADLKEDIVEVLQSYQLDRHIKKDEDGQKLVLNKHVYLDPEFEKLWNSIKIRTTFSVEYRTDEFVANTVKAIKAMPKIEPVKVHVAEVALDLQRKGVASTMLRDAKVTVAFTGAVPDIIAYLQNEVDVTRATIVRVLRESGRLADFLVNPQKFMDAVVPILKNELHRLLIYGIKYEKLPDQEYSMRLFENPEIMSYLNNRLEVQKSVYDAIVYESEVERKFAEALDQRTDIKLFVKLPNWFKIETPLGTYNPDWAILKHDDTVLYLVRETKSTKNFEKLRNSEAQKVRCGRRHFEAIGADYDVVTSASEI
jgi:type III restriction enzyme